MNANEIADELEMVMDGYAIAITASGMLRQQQAEIDALRKELDTANKAYMWMDETYKGNLAEIEALKAKVKQWEEWKESLNGWSKK
jgi:predicted  nucleic acid-binding Zn-ribbon protein